MHYISEFIRSAASDIYSGMVNLPLEAVSGDDTTVPPLPAGGVTASIQFDGGFDASLHITYTEKLAKGVTQAMMGAEPASVSAPEVGDVLGELANMIGGNFKAKMAAKGISGNASAPKITPNGAFTTKPASGTIALFNAMKVPALGDVLEIRVFAKV